MPPFLNLEQALLRAKKAAKQGRTTEALQVYTEILRQYPQHPIAKKALRKLQKISPHPALSPSPSHLNALEHVYRSGDMIKTVQTCQQLLSSFPHSFVVLNALGAALMAQGKYREAVQVFDQAIKTNKKSAEAYYNRGIALRGMEQINEAVKSYDKAIQIKPDYAEAYYNRGNALKDLGELNAAVSSYDQAIQLKPSYAVAYYNRGNALKDLERLDEALASYDRMIQLQPDYAEAYNNRGNVLKDLGRENEAIKSLEQALIVDPECLGADYLLNALRGQTTDCAPKKFIASVFDDYAQRFDSHLVSHLEYSAPTVLRKAVDASGLAQKKFGQAMDLGCGTGLSGLAFRDIADSLTGIDLSDKMVQKAAEKNIYDALYVDEIVDRLESLNNVFDLFISTDVFIYIGNLQPLFLSVKKHSTPTSLFAFSTEHLPAGTFMLQKSGRYAHTKEYILSLAEPLGFTLAHFSTFDLRKEKNQWIAGGIYVLKTSA